jgi:uncharacterized protein YecT (DUF1311 family)
MSPIRAALIALLLCPSAALAQQTRPVVCLDTASTQWAMTICAGEGYKLSIATLDRLLAELRDSLPAPRRPQLDSTQRAWVQYTSVQCRLQNADSEDGSAYPMLVSLCRTAQTNLRIRELAPLLCIRSDMSDEPCLPAAKYLAGLAPASSRP